MNQPMNREQKRMLKRRGQLGADGAPAAAEPRQRPSRQAGTRTSPLQFLREVRSEMGKVAWPTGAETANYSVVVFITLTLLILAIFGLDYVSAKGAFFLFE